MFKRIFQCLLFCVLGLLRAFAAEPPVLPTTSQASPLSGLEVLRGEFPISLRFRSEKLDNGNGKHAPPLEETEASIATETDGTLEKMLHDIGRYGSEGHQAIAQMLPNKLMMEHLLFSSVSRVFSEDLNGAWPFSPAHFAYYEGCRAVGIPQPNATVINVNDPRKFRQGDAVILLPLQGSQRLWAASEYAAILAIRGQTLTVRRAVYNSTVFDPQRTRCDSVWIAAMPEDFSDSKKSKTQFTWNWSATCPRDERGRRAIDAYVEALGGVFSAQGVVSRIHGLAWDVPRVSFKEKGSEGRAVDADMDGRGDDAIKNGVNEFALGAVELHRKVRAMLGDQRMFLSDGYYGDDEDPRLQLPAVFNGIEHDVNKDHHLREVTSLLNVISLYQRHATRPSLSLLVRKEDKFDRRDGGPSDAARRQNECMKNAMATILGMAYSDLSFDGVEPGKAFSAADETQCGKDNRLHWLGKPVGPIIRPALDAPDELKGDGVQLSNGFIDRWKSTDAEARREGDHVLLRSKTSAGAISPDRDPLTFTLPGIPTKKDRGVLIQFEVAADQMRDYAADVPRIIAVTPAAWPGWPERKKVLRSLLGWATTGGYAPVSFYFGESQRDAPTNFAISIQGRQNVRIRNFTIRDSNEVFARRYEHGVVLCNPNERTSWTFDLAKLFPGMKLRRLTAAPYDLEMARVDTGEKVGNTLTMAPQTGLFLAEASP